MVPILMVVSLIAYLLSTLILKDHFELIQFRK